MKFKNLIVHRLARKYELKCKCLIVHHQRALAVNSDTAHQFLQFRLIDDPKVSAPSPCMKMHCGEKYDITIFEKAQCTAVEKSKLAIT